VLVEVGVAVASHGGKKFSKDPTLHSASFSR